jgi:hypothetical protein
MLYNHEIINFTKCRTCRHAQYKPKTGREGLFSHIENRDTS